MYLHTLIFSLQITQSESDKGRIRDSCANTRLVDSGNHALQILL